MPSQYSKSGVEFVYPENWELAEAEPDAAEGETLVEVTLRSPNTAFWSLTVYPGERDPSGLLAEVVQAMQAEYPDLEHEPADASMGETRLVGAEIRFVCLDFTNTALAHVYHHQGATHLLLRQAEDREWEQVEPVLRAITLSLLTALPAEQ